MSTNYPDGFFADPRRPSYLYGNDADPRDERGTVCVQCDHCDEVLVERDVRDLEHGQKVAAGVVCLACGPDGSRGYVNQYAVGEVVIKWSDL